MAEKSISFVLVCHCAAEAAALDSAGMLTPQGVEDAIRMGDHLAEIYGGFDLAYTSPTRRTLGTAMVMLARCVNSTAPTLVKIPEMYLVGDFTQLEKHSLVVAKEFVSQAKAIDEEEVNVLVVGHAVAIPVTLTRILEEFGFPTLTGISNSIASCSVGEGDALCLEFVFSDDQVIEVHFGQFQNNGSTAPTPVCVESQEPVLAQ